MNYRKEISPEYIYTTVPAEYVCVYHRILAMLADYGEEMLKDCKAGCTDKNSGVIECYNMFNAAVAARQLGQEKKATLIINYIKAKINQIYGGTDNSTSFVFPIDENGALKAFVSCGDRPRFWIDNGVLYKQKEDDSKDVYSIEDETKEKGYTIPFDFETEATIENGKLTLNITYIYKNRTLSTEEASDVVLEIYINDEYVSVIDDYDFSKQGTYALRIVAYYVGAAYMHEYVVDNYEEVNNETPVEESDDNNNSEQQNND